MKESNDFDQNTSTFSYQLYDNQKPFNLVLVHGFLGSQRIWDNMIDELSEHFNVLTLDLPGHGQTKSNCDILRMEDMAEQLYKLIQFLKFERFHLVGHSMGGYIALALLHQHPQLFLSLSLLNSTATADSEIKKADRLRAVRVFELNPAIFVNEAILNLFYSPNIDKFHNEVTLLQKIALEADPKGAQACLKGMRERTDYTDLVNATDVPIQYLSGIYDNTVPYELILSQIKSPAIQLVSFKNSGHMSFVEERDLCLSSIINFCSAIKS